MIRIAVLDSVDAIETGTPPVVGFDDGHKALVFAGTALKPIAQGRSVMVEEIS